MHHDRPVDHTNRLILTSCRAVSDNRSSKLTCCFSALKHHPAAPTQPGLHSQVEKHHPSLRRVHHYNSKNVKVFFFLSFFWGGVRLFFNRLVFQSGEIRLYVWSRYFCFYILLHLLYAQYFLKEIVFPLSLKLSQYSSCYLYRLETLSSTEAVYVQINKDIFVSN